MIKTEKINLKSTKQFEMIDITEKVKSILERAGTTAGTVSVFSPHTTAAVRINHNEPLLIQDIMKTIYRLAPIDINYGHDLFEIRTGVDASERSNGHAHVKDFLLGASEVIPIIDKKLALGQTQSIFLVELDGARPRQVYVTINGE